MMEEWASKKGWSPPPVVNDEEGGSSEGNHVDETAGPASAAGPAVSSQTRHVEEEDEYPQRDDRIDPYAGSVLVPWLPELTMDDIQDGGLAGEDVYL
jgi:hypothetical protein